MEALLSTLYILGFLESIFAWVWFLIVAFRTGVGHGILMLFCGGIYSILFSIQHWEEARKPFFTALIGSALMIGSTWLQPRSVPRYDFAEEQELTPATAPGASFKQKLASAIAARIAATTKRAGHRTADDSSARPASAPAPITVRAVGSNTPKFASSLMAFAAKATTPAEKAAVTGEWEQAHALLRVTGVIQTGTQLFAHINQQIVGVNEVVAVEFNGRPYPFKVRRIDLEQMAVQFDPLP